MTITLTQEDADTILAYLRGQLSEENRVYALMKATAITGFPDSKTMIERHHAEQTCLLSKFIELLTAGSPEANLQ